MTRHPEDIYSPKPVQPAIGGLFAILEPAPEPDGQTFEPAKDGKRLAKQHGRIAKLMADHRWRTLAEISELTHDPEASVSARLRDLRKPKFGGLTVERRRKSDGQYEYRLVYPERTERTG